MIECLSELSAWLSTFLKLSILAFNLLFSHRNTKSPFLKLPREIGGEKCYLSSAPSKTLQDNRKTRIFLPLTPWPCKLMAFCCKYINKQGPCELLTQGVRSVQLHGLGSSAPSWHLIHLMGGLGCPEVGQEAQQPSSQKTPKETDTDTEVITLNLSIPEAPHLCLALI